MSTRSEHADVLIAGGGIAGSSLAIQLGRLGLHVELFERSQFPREKPCGEGLMPAGVAVLERLGLAGAAGGAPFHGIRYHSNGTVAEGRFPRVNGLPATGRAQRRLHLDRVLFEAAAATPNVKATSGATVEAPLLERGRVAGLRVNGEERRARLVVAADGVHSRLRHSLHLHVPVRYKRMGARAHFRLAAGQSLPPWVDVFVCRGFELYVAPLPGRELLVAALAEPGVVTGPIERAFQRWCGVHPDLAARLEGAEQTSELLCASPLAGRARVGFAPGIVFLGDAAGFSDPLTGGGMTQALQSAELFTACIQREWSSPRYRASQDACCEEAGWLAAFDRRRWALLRDYWQVTQMALWLARHPRIAGPAVGALHFFPGLLSHLIGVAGGVCPLLGRNLEEGGEREQPFPMGFDG